MTYTTAWTCRMAAVMWIALFGTGQARAADGADITNEIQKWCNLYDTTRSTKGPVAVANTFFADDAVFIPPNGAVIKGQTSSQKSGAIFTKSQPFISALFKNLTQRAKAGGR